MLEARAVICIRMPKDYDDVVVGFGICVQRRTMRIMKRFRVAAYAVGVLGLAVNAHADLFQGWAWDVSNSAVSCATAVLCGTTQGGQVGTLVSLGKSHANADFTFSGNAINFDSRSGGNDSAFYTVGSWLTTGGVTNTVAYNGKSLTDALNNNGGGIIFEFQGLATFANGQSYTLAHDDGLSMYVGGSRGDPGLSSTSTILYVPEATAPALTSFIYPNGVGSAPTGNGINFDFVYAECCGAPAVFTTTLVSGVPEPGSITLFGTVLVGVAGALRRKMRA